MTDKSFTPFVESHYSLLRATSKMPKIVERCVELGYTSCALTDYGSVSGAVAFSKACDKAGIKPILGCKLTVDNSELKVIAKNLTGWKNLIQAVSRSYDKDMFDKKPMLNLEALAGYCDNLIGISGPLGTSLANAMFERAFSPFDEIDAQSALYYDCVKRVETAAMVWQDVFGKGNFFIEIQTIDKENIPVQGLIADILRQVSKSTGIPCIAGSDSRYVNKADAVDHHILLCADMKMTLPGIEKLRRSGQLTTAEQFFRSDNYHIPSVEDLQYNTEEEIANTQEINDLCESYSILSKPRLPLYEWTEGMSESEYLKKLCREGWVKKRTNMWDTKVYGDRVKREFAVFDKAHLNGYFLIVQDFVNEAKRRGYLVGPGRGSCGGSLVAYLTGIINIDPVKFDLLFERFYNEGRNTEERVSLPDIDIDFPIHKRDEMIEYVSERYGEDRVCQMATFGRMQGRSALQEVMRAHEACSYAEITEISKKLPQEFEIAEHLESSGETSIIRWTLENEPKLVSDYCRLDDGVFQGDYSFYFEQAIRLEGTFKSIGKHAAGLIISDSILSEVCPMINDKSSDKKIAGMDMGDLEDMGLCKFDFLGIAALSKLMGVNNLLRYGKIKP